MGVLEVLIGLPASGKSTYAKSVEGFPRAYRINWDNMRKELGTFGKPFNSKKEKEIQTISYQRAVSAASAGYLRIIIDNTNLNEKTRDTWRNVARQIDFVYVETRFDKTITECVIRDHDRLGSERVGRAVIERMALWNGLVTLYEPCIIVDVDGTLADCSHRQHYVNKPCLECAGKIVDNCRCNGSGLAVKDWHGFFGETANDPPIPTIVDLVKLLSKTYKILIVSVRPIDKCGKATEDWLNKHEIPCYRLFMRNSGDKRDDTIVKQEILDRLDKSKIALVLDDRDRVVDMWRQNGLTCLQVAPGAF